MKYWLFFTSSNKAGGREKKAGGGGGGGRENSCRRKIQTMVRQKRARLYIARRCLVMLLCWQEDPMMD
ncbi:hypothetical protein V2J09_010271 [Rumex salicifolius]